jgi:hypothetical protein
MRPDPIFNRLTAHILTAAKQFAAVNRQILTGHVRWLIY